MPTGVVYKAKSGPSTEPCETLYESVTLSVRVSVIVISRPTKLVRGINVTSDFRPPSVCISFPVKSILKRGIILRAPMCSIYVANHIHKKKLILQSKSLCVKNHIFFT